MTMANYSTGCCCAHWFDDVEVIRQRERTWALRDAEQTIVPLLWRDPICYHEAAHAVVGTALGQRVESVKLLQNSDGVTHGTTRYDDGFDVIASMICLAAGRAGQEKFGARAEVYRRWCDDDERQLIDLALDLVESQPRRDRKQNALRLIAGAEEVAARLVDQLWDKIEHIARELVIREELDEDDVAELTKDVPRINFRSEPLREDATVDGKPFRIRRDGYLRPIGGSR
jgi:hypothetical protein